MVRSIARETYQQSLTTILVYNSTGSTVNFIATETYQQSSKGITAKSGSITDNAIG